MLVFLDILSKKNESQARTRAPRRKPEQGSRT
jgi:hypothetical protein